MFKIRVGAGLLVLALVMLTSTDVRPAVAASAARSTAMSREPGQALCRYPGGPTSLDARQGDSRLPEHRQGRVLFGAQFGEAQCAARARLSATTHRGGSYGLQAESRRSGTSCSS